MWRISEELTYRAESTLPAHLPRDGRVLVRIGIKGCCHPLGCDPPHTICVHLEMLYIGRQELACPALELTSSDSGESLVGRDDVFEQAGGECESHS